MEWRVFHRYATLVDRNLVPPLVCSVCETDLQLKLGKDDEPELECYWCVKTFKPGITLYEQLEEAVNEYSADNEEEV